MKASKSFVFAHVVLRFPMQPFSERIANVSPNSNYLNPKDPISFYNLPFSVSPTMTSADTFFWSLSRQQTALDTPRPLLDARQRRAFKSCYTLLQENSGRRTSPHTLSRRENVRPPEKCSNITSAYIID